MRNEGYKRFDEGDIHALLEDLSKYVGIGDLKSVLRGFYEIERRLYNEKERQEFLRDLGSILQEIEKRKNDLRIYSKIIEMYEKSKSGGISEKERQIAYEVLTELEKRGIAYRDPRSGNWNFDSQKFSQFIESTRPYMEAFKLIASLLEKPESKNLYGVTMKVGMIETALRYSPGVTKYLPNLFNVLDRAKDPKDLNLIYESFKDLMRLGLNRDVVYSTMELAYHLAERSSLDTLKRFVQLIRSNYVLSYVAAAFQTLQKVRQEMSPAQRFVLDLGIRIGITYLENLVKKRYGIEVSLESFKSGDVEKFVEDLEKISKLNEKVAEKILSMAIGLIHKKVEEILGKRIHLPGTVYALQSKPESKPTSMHIFSFIAGVLAGSLLTFGSSTAFFGMTISGSLWLAALATLGITSLVALYFLVFRRKKILESKRLTRKKVRKLK